MTIFRGAEFSTFKDFGSAGLFCNLEFRNCSFTRCSISATYDPAKRTTVSNIKIFNCHETRCSIGPAIIENCIVNGLTNTDLLIVKSAAFKHVVLKGQIGRLLLGQVLPPAGILHENYLKIVSWFEQANAEYYKGVDWALDISEAEFEDFDVRGIPSRLIRRDPFTQAVVKREKVLNNDWKKVDLSGTWWHVSLEMLAKSNWEDDTLVAPKRHPQFKQAVKGLYRLREAGIAEPD